MDLCAHPKERALAFELTQFSGVVASVAEEFLPVRVCDYLYKVSCKFTEFVTECKVLDDARMAERVVLCEATGVVMRACFDLLGIEHPCRFKPIGSCVPGWSFLLPPSSSSRPIQ